MKTKLPAPKTCGVIAIAALLLVPLMSYAKQEWKLWYESPAETWNEALPIGNGRLGAMMYGKVAQEQIQLNETSVWSGSEGNYDRVGAYKHLPEIRRLLFEGKNDLAERMASGEILGDRPLGAYQPLGDLWLDFPIEGKVSEYRRELDLEKALARTSYKHEGVLYTREVFASAPAQVIVVRLKSDQKGKLSFAARLNRIEGATMENDGGKGLVMRGQADAWKPTAGTCFVARLRAVNKGGQVKYENGALKVNGADEVTLYLSAASDYRGGDGEADSRSILEKALKVSVDQLQAEQLADHTRYFERVSLSLGDDDRGKLPTDARLRRVQAGEKDPGLIALFFHYGRYLLISGSREGGLPVHLQGIWNEHLAPPWFSGWHIDINVQMNYWPAELLDLGDLHMPLFDMIDRLRVNGRRTARDVFNARGFYISHRTNAWEFTSPVKGLILWPMGATWLVQHFWMHYEFTGDKVFLEKRAYPAMKEAAEFCLDWLVKDPREGTLVSGPSISPENSLLLPNGKRTGQCMAPAMDQQLIAELFDRCLMAAKILNINDDFVKEVTEARKNLASGLRIGSDGRLMEWAQEYKEYEPGHRHVSHLYAAYPGDAVSLRKTPELAKAVKASLIYRITAGESAKGKGNNLSDNSNVEWSLVWNAGIWARLGEAEQADYAIHALLQRTTFDNLFTMHPRKGVRGVFQIDGNLGGPAVIGETLLQSHAGEIEILPALPPSWKEGSYKGLRARGGYSVDASWKNGILKEAGIRASITGPCVVRTPIAVEIYSGGRLLGKSREVSGGHLLHFEAEAGREYHISPVK